jgi:histidinol-phosphate phosphatase family protein
VNVEPRVDIVVPSAGRPSLHRLLEALAACEGPPPGRVLVVDDRRRRLRPLLEGHLPEVAPVTVLPGMARGPAAARNLGWRAARAEWVAFLDDDVVPEPDWLARLDEDLRDLAADVAGSQGRIRVPLPADRRPTDWERNVRGLEEARWATADMAYRRAALHALDGFDERFPRAYREDADLALRALDGGWRLVRGGRRTEHPVAAAGRLVSVRLQAGNADDALMRALHGRRWRERAGVPRGRRTRHLAVTAAGLGAAGALAGGRRRTASALFAAWAAGTAELAWARIAQGPRSRDEVATMLLTSVLVPPAAGAWWLAGLAHVARRPGGAPAARHAPQAVLLDRDGTLVVDVPYNGDPERVVPMPGARCALDRLRSAGVRLAVVSNQSGVARGSLTPEQVEAVNRRVEELLGPIGTWLYCPHAPGDGCDCRKPAAGMLLDAAQRLGVDPARCALIGDTGADVDAARAAGARPVLVPTPVTRPEEIAAAPEVAPDIEAAVEVLIGGRA